MMLPALIAVLILGGFAAWFSERWSPEAPRWVAVIALGVETLLVAGQTKQTGSPILTGPGFPDSVSVFTWRWTDSVCCLSR